MIILGKPVNRFNSLRDSLVQYGQSGKSFIASYLFLPVIAFKRLFDLLLSFYCFYLPFSVAFFFSLIVFVCLPNL